MNKFRPQERFRGILLPRGNSKEAAVVKVIETLPLDSLSDCVEFLNGELHIDPVEVDLEEIFKTEANYPVDFSEVKPPLTAQQMSRPPNQSA